MAFLVIIAVLPGFLIFSWIMYMDRREKEPLGLALKVMLAGALSVIPAALIESFLNSFAILPKETLIGAAQYSFLKIAPVEEFCKLYAAKLIIWRDPHFNEENDGVVYMGASALGFAMLENIFYVVPGGFGLAVTRALTALPLHTFTGVIIGYFIGVARFTKPEKANRLIFQGFLIAWFTHGLYNTLLLTGTKVVLLAIPLVIAIYIVGVIYLNKGRLLSLQRWGRLPRPPCIENDLKTATSDGSACISVDERRLSKDRWKIIISRTLLGCAIIFWVFLTWAYLEPGASEELTLDEFLGGGLVITFIPILIGVLLETSYHRSRTRNL